MEEMTTAQYRTLAREAQERCDWRLATIYYTRALDKYPATPGQLAKRDKNNLLNERTECKHQLTHTCPVCGHYPILDNYCCDDYLRPYCEHCERTFEPMGYMDEDGYGLKWIAINWNGSDEPREIIEVI